MIMLPPEMPPDLSRQLALLTRPFDPDYESQPPEPRYDPAAAAWLERKRSLLAPGERGLCYAWLAALAQGINGVTPELLGARGAAIWSMCQGLPGIVWCEATMHAMWARTAFLPSPGECREVLVGHAERLRREIRALERIVAAQHKEAEERAERVRRAQGALEWSDPLVIQTRVRDLEGNPLRLTLGRFLATAVQVNAPQLIDLVPEEFRAPEVTVPSRKVIPFPGLAPGPAA